MMLIHCIFGLWAHTATGIFATDAYIVQLDINVLNNTPIARIFLDILMLALAGLIAVWIVVDFSIIALFNMFRECCCKD